MDVPSFKVRDFRTAVPILNVHKRLFSAVKPLKLVCFSYYF